MAKRSRTSPHSVPRLMLQVGLQGVIQRELPLRPGISFGSDPENTVCLNTLAVKPFHAEVDDSLCITCAQGAFLTLSDGSQVNSLLIVPGVVFAIGPAIVECVAAVEPLEEAKPWDGRPCLQCQTDLAGLPVGVRFCPWCGACLPTSLQALPDCAARVVHRPEPVPLRAGLGQRLCSLVIRGYASAMAGLGWRYEAGLGLQKNEHEAERCYTKAARLGNDQARARLLARQSPPDQS